MNRRLQVGFIVLLDFQFLLFLEQSAGRFVGKFPAARLVEQALPGAVVLVFIVLNVGLIAIGLACYGLWIRPGLRRGRTALWLWITLETGIAMIHLLWAALAGGRYVPGLAASFLLLGACAWLALRLRDVPEPAAKPAPAEAPKEPPQGPGAGSGQAPKEPPQVPRQCQGEPGAGSGHAAGLPAEEPRE